MSAAGGDRTPTAQGNPLLQLALANLRELIRQPTTFFFILIFPFMFMGIFYLVLSMMTGSDYAIGMYSPQPPGVLAQNVAGYMEAAEGIAYRAVDDENAGRILLEAGEIDALIVLPAQAGGRLSASVIAPSGNSGAGMMARQILLEADHALRGAVIETVGMDGKGLYDPMRASIPAVLITAFASLAFFGTATPTIQLRQQGTLRLLGTTPLSKLTFLGGQLIPRFGIAVLQTAVMFAIAHRMGFLKTDRIPELVISSLLGLLMFFAFGYLIGGLMNSPEVASAILAPLLPLLLIFGGVFLPLEAMPEALAGAARFIPVTYLGDAISQTMVGSEPKFALTTSWAVLLAASALMTAAAAVTFRWDGGESR